MWNANDINNYKNELIMTLNENRIDLAVSTDF